MRTTIAATILAAGSLLAFSPATAQTTGSDTLQVVSGPTGSRGPQIQFYGPVGQSFTSIDSTLTSFGFQFQTFNSSSPNTPVTFSLLSGAGLGGPVLYSQTLNLRSDLPARTGVFTDFSVPNLSVAVGQSYTATLSATSNRFGLALGPEYSYTTGKLTGGDAYDGGQAYFSRPSSYSNCNGAGSNCDFNFRVTGFNTVAAVPEPATWALMICGFGLVGGTLRRRRPALAVIAA